MFDNVDIFDKGSYICSFGSNTLKEIGLIVLEGTIQVINE